MLGDINKRLRCDGFELSEKILQLKVPSPNDELRLIDVADAETIPSLAQKATKLPDGAGTALLSRPRDRLQWGLPSMPLLDSLIFRHHRLN